MRTKFIKIFIWNRFFYPKKKWIFFHAQLSRLVFFSNNDLNWNATNDVDQNQTNESEIK